MSLTVTEHTSKCIIKIKARKKTQRKYKIISLSLLNLEELTFHSLFQFPPLISWQTSQESGEKELTFVQTETKRKRKNRNGEGQGILRVDI
ncbi:hypothetical protein GBA52_018431 [Prunus armeniaca]|nr:hypothetical protein GBA52_018431 [Prunus armeniaca]